MVWNDINHLRTSLDKFCTRAGVMISWLSRRRLNKHFNLVIIIFLSILSIGSGNSAQADSLKLLCHVQGEQVENGKGSGAYTADKVVFMNQSEARCENDKAFQFNNCKWTSDGANCFKETQAMVKQTVSFVFNAHTGGAWYLNVVLINQKSFGNSWVGKCEPIDIR